MYRIPDRSFAILYLCRGRIYTAGKVDSPVDCESNERFKADHERNTYTVRMVQTRNASKGRCSEWNQVLKIEDNREKSFDFMVPVRVFFLKNAGHALQYADPEVGRNW